MPAHNIAHCNTPSGIAKRSRVYVPRIAADKCRAYAEFVRFIAKRDTCYGTRDTKAIAQRSREAHPDVCFHAIISRDITIAYPRIWENSSSSATLIFYLSPQKHCLHDVILFLFLQCTFIQINKSSRYICINKHTNISFLSSLVFISLIFTFLFSTSWIT